jgi:hypothetical protein
VDAPTKDDLARMQHSPWVLRGCEGRITGVPAEKATLPHDPKGHPQGANVAQIADGTLYMAHSEGACCLLCTLRSQGPLESELVGC